jgi:hypothetical protein
MLNLIVNMHITYSYFGDMSLLQLTGTLVTSSRMFSMYTSQLYILFWNRTNVLSQESVRIIPSRLT